MAPLNFDERLERLLTTAAEVFAANGYHPTTMRELSRATGMSLAGMYHYVRGKDELLALVQRRCFTRVLDGAEQAVARGADPTDRVERFIRHHVTFFAEHMSEMKVLSHEADSVSPARRAAIDRLKRRYADLLVELIAAATPEGAPGARLDVRVAAYGLFGMMNWIYTWYDPEGPVDPAALAEQLTTLFLHGTAGAAQAPAPAGRD